MIKRFIKRIRATECDDKHVEEPQLIITDVQNWIKKENPYQHITEQDKRILPSIGTTINSIVRRGKEDDATHMFDRLIEKNTLKDDIVVYRGVTNQDYERDLAQKRGLGDSYLYYDGYIFCSLNADTHYWNRQIRMIISVSAGSNYLFTGKYSNTAESNEIILNRNSILQIEKEADFGNRHYMWVKLINSI